MKKINPAFDSYELSHTGDLIVINKNHLFKKLSLFERSKNE